MNLFPRPFFTKKTAWHFAHGISLFVVLIVLVLIPVYTMKKSNPNNSVTKKYELNDALLSQIKNSTLGAIFQKSNDKRADFERTIVDNYFNSLAAQIQDATKTKFSSSITVEGIASTVNDTIMKADIDKLKKRSSDIEGTVISLSWTAVVSLPDTTNFTSFMIDLGLVRNYLNQTVVQPDGYKDGFLVPVNVDAIEITDFVDSTTSLISSTSITNSIQTSSSTNSNILASITTTIKTAIT